MAKPRTRQERLFAAAVLRRSFELRGDEHREEFQFVYAGVLRDLSLQPAEVDAFLAGHRDEIDAAIGRGPKKG